MCDLAARPVAATPASRCTPPCRTSPSRALAHDTTMARRGRQDERGHGGSATRRRPWARLIGPRRRS